MAFFVKMPVRVSDGDTCEFGEDERYLNIINGKSTLMQRELRRNGYGGYETHTVTAICALFQQVVRDDGLVTFFDVGANGGFYSLLCKGIFGGASRVVAFEPAPETFRWLRAMSIANGFDVETVQKAVSDTTEPAVLYLSEKSDASNSLNRSFKARHKGEVVVECTTLDLYCAHEGLEPTVLKIDAETHEAHVLRGGFEMIRRARPWMVVEAIRKNGIDYGLEIMKVVEEVGGYLYYAIEEDALVQKTTIETVEGTETRDWLLAPKPLDSSLTVARQRWKAALAECTAQRNIVP